MINENLDFAPCRVQLQNAGRVQVGDFLQPVAAESLHACLANEVSQDTVLRRLNTLPLFAVPTGHAVSLVAPWAGEEPLAITGWLLT